MPRLGVTILVGPFACVSVAFAGEALDFSGTAYFGGLLVAMLLTSLTDPERFGWR